MDCTRNLDLDLVFPIRDQASALLMSFKAHCLFRADVISESERQRVRAKAIATDERQAA
jgi:hypothetical protein